MRNKAAIKPTDVVVHQMQILQLRQIREQADWHRIADELVVAQI